MTPLGPRIFRRLFPHGNYGIVILAASAVGILAGAAGHSFVLGCFTEAIAADLQLSSAAVGSCFMVAIIVSSLYANAVGAGADRLGSRRLVCAAALPYAAALASLSLVSDPWSLQAAVLAVRMLGPETIDFACRLCVTQWWVQRRGFAVGALNTVSALASTLPAAIAPAIGVLGWRETLRAMAVAMGSAALLVGATLVHRPEDAGLKPDTGEPSSGRPVRRASAFHRVASSRNHASAAAAASSTPQAKLEGAAATPPAGVAKLHDSGGSGGGTVPPPSPTAAPSVTPTVALPAGSAASKEGSKEAPLGAASTAQAAVPARVSPMSGEPAAAVGGSSSSSSPPERVNSQGARLRRAVPFQRCSSSERVSSATSPRPPPSGASTVLSSPSPLGGPRSGAACATPATPASPATPSVVSAPAAEAQHETNMTLWQAASTCGFWLLVAYYVLCGGLWNAINFHMGLILRGEGIDAGISNSGGSGGGGGGGGAQRTSVQALRALLSSGRARYLGAYTHTERFAAGDALEDAEARASLYLPLAAASAMSALLGGLLSDALRDRYKLLALVLPAAAMGACLAAFGAGAVRSPASLLAAGTALGCYQGLDKVIAPVVAASLFGRKHNGRIEATLLVTRQLSGALGVQAMGVAIESIGSTGPALRSSACAIGLFCAALCLVVAATRAPTAPQKLKAA